MPSSDQLRQLESRMKIQPDRVTPALEAFIREHVDRLEREGVILGLSGGLDSAVLADLCKRAVGPDKILALIMPDKDSKKEHIRDAQELAAELNINTKLIDISPYLKQLGVYKLFFLNKYPLLGKLKEPLVKKAYDLYGKMTGERPFAVSILGLKDKKFNSYLTRSNAYYRVKHRLRMLLLYLDGELENKLVAGAANRTEYEIGYFVKHGCDDAADIMPLAELYKTQVRELARYLNIPKRIVEKPPSPDIIPGIIDEDAIGMPYETLDLTLLAFQEGWDNSQIALALKLDEKEIVHIRNLAQRSEHMRKIYTLSNT